ncbi:MAG: hypothetical protein ABSB74_05805 [Tepidisphaeraceae bacterium]
MGKVRTDRFRLPPLSVAWQPGLPAGIRQADCDGRADDLADADGNRLWIACDPRQQESVSARFVHDYAERLRDALLDTQDAFGLATASPDDAPGALLGRLLWTMWISYRDRALREMVRRGDLSSI